MKKRPGLNVILRPKRQEILDETDNVVMLATSFGIELTEESLQSAIRLNHLNLLPFPESSDYVSLDEAARMTRLKKNKILQLIELGKIESITIEGTLLILRKSIDKFL